MLPNKKKKKLGELGSYMSCSLRTVASKVLEKLLFKHLKSTGYINDLISNHQVGFREGHSKMEQVQ